ncbi:ATP-dependent DNA helicase 2 subunit KU70 [Selaginella moellendorffii]|uniref:ATP-dependent DNA helicase 2 subunit KU70 n=1 Tax=Selaginella moellendorffii TaxID=88036 RepID=UPI000D1C4D18|nr:ATP-dependent DNA helicase 2 subunit KU70 [Selaginella moellendorffii]|eukprot:XP_024517551.1 ATP-dependent DNA helicase 2 subunit KU70 [Selaginella moellendorffii]
MADNGDDPYADEEEDEEDEYAVEGATRDYVVFLIDAGKDMLLQLQTKRGETKTYLEAVMESITEDLKTRIISRDSDEVGICFINTREKNNSLSSEGVYTFKELSKLSASFIKDTSSLCENFDSVIGSNDGSNYGARENPLYNGLWVAQGMLGKSATKNLGKRILLFTNNDDPFENADPVTKADMRRTTIQRAKDSQDLGISIELYPMSRPGEEFNLNIFYKDMITMEDDELSNFMVGAEKRFEELKARMRKKLFQKRVVRKITFTIANGTSIGLGTYAMVRPATTGKYEWLDSTTNKPVKSERALICTDTGAIVTESTKRFTHYNSKRVLMTREELAEVKKITDVQLRLLGFKSIACLKDYHNLRPATFLYPSEEAIKGSTCLFIALHRSLIRQKKFALAFHGNSTSPHLVALVPQEEIVNEYGQVQPPGMHMIYLPYAEDIRQPEKINLSKGGVEIAAKEHIDKAMALIKKLHLREFTVYDIQNPALQRHYSNLQALGLQEDTVEEVEDCTLPDEEGMKRPSIVAVVQAFKDTVYGADHDQEEAAAEAERAKGSVTAQKRKAAAEVATKESEKYNWRQLALDGELKKLTVVELKYYLAGKKLPLSGKKEILIERILNDLGM